MKNEQLKIEPDNHPDITPIFRFKSQALEERNERAFPVKSVCFITKHPGPGNYFSSVANYVRGQGVEVYVAAREKGKEKLEKGIPSHQLEPIVATPHVEWALISNDGSPDFALEQIARLRTVNPSVRVAVCEDIAGSIQNVLVDLKRQGIQPDIVFATTQSERSAYGSSFPELQERIITVGQPSFITLTKEERQVVRDYIEELANHTHTLEPKMIVFGGVPRSDYKEFPIDNIGADLPYTDLNSQALYLSLRSVREIAAEHPDQHYVFVYRPHPRDTAERGFQAHPYLKLLSDIPNVTVLGGEREYWKDKKINFPQPDDQEPHSKDLETNMLSIAADATVNTTSTLSHEITFAALSQGEGGPSLPIIIQLTKYWEKYKEVNPDEAEELLGPGRFLRMYHAALFVQNPDEITEVMRQALETKNVRNNLSDDQLHMLAEEFRILGLNPSQRIYYWLNKAQRLGH